MSATISPVSYWSSVAVAAALCLTLCITARRHPGPWRVDVARVIGLLLAADAVSYTVALVMQGTWSVTTSLPLALCNVGVVIAAVACWWRTVTLVELTYFWGLAGTIQGVLTPDLNVGFPHLVFFEYVAGHLGIVMAALFLVVGMGIVPRPGAVPRVFAVTVGYTALVGAVDALTGANYMFLRRPPGEWTLLRLLGPWPWYLVTASVVAITLFTLLDLPFWPARRRARVAVDRPGGPSGPGGVGQARSTGSPTIDGAQPRSSPRQ
jgi:hypothetical integral membrane protein (TIGR02206 family)